jgi:hypothetical protein
VHELRELRARIAWASCSDRPIPIPHGLVTTQPSLGAAMIAGLALTGGEHVLHIGSGYGYQTALLARLAADVIRIEIYPDIARAARRNLVRRGIANVHVITCDGTEGYPPGAPSTTRFWCRPRTRRCLRRCPRPSSSSCAREGGWSSPSALAATRRSSCSNASRPGSGSCGCSRPPASSGSGAGTASAHPLGERQG